MGRFFTSTQIYIPKQLDRDGFKADFCKKMKKEGYEVCEADCAELSYVLAFADNCKWVTISSEAYEQGNRTSQADTARIAKMLGTYCVNTIVIDSDCAMLDLYDDKGKKADTLVMGRADDYLGDDIPAPAKAVWEKFLSADSTWEQFMSIVHGDYVFVEDGLFELAPVIEMDSGNILFEYEDADENNENFCYLSFRKASSKKGKKLTLNAAFKQVFGEALEPLGYKKVNGSNPYFVRVIGNEVIHVITIVTKSTAPGLKLFEICGDVRSIYNSSNYFSKKPEDAYRESYFDISNFKVYSYRLHHEDYDFDYQRKISGFLCNDDNASIINKMNEALETSQELLLPFIDSINNIDELYKYLLQYHSSKLYSWQELLYLRISNYSDIISELRQTANDVYYKCVELKRNGYTEEEYKRRITKAGQVDQRRRNAIKEVRDNPKQYAEYMKNEEEAKEGTIKVLKNFGII